MSLSTWPSPFLEPCGGRCAARTASSLIVRKMVLQVKQSIVRLVTRWVPRGELSQNTRSATAARVSTVLIPSWVRHTTEEDVVRDSQRDDRNRAGRRAMDSGRPDVPDAILWIHIRDKDHRIVLRAMTNAVDWIESVDPIGRGV